MKNTFLTGYFAVLCLFAGAQYSIVQKADVPGVFRHHASGFSINGMGYWGMGRTDGGTNLTDWYMYNPGTDT